MGNVSGMACFLPLCAMSSSEESTSTFIPSAFTTVAGTVGDSFGEGGVFAMSVVLVTFVVEHAAMNSSTKASAANCFFILLELFLD